LIGVFTSSSFAFLFFSLALSFLPLLVDDGYSLVPLVCLTVVEVVGGLLHLRQIVAPVLKASTASSFPTVLVSPHTEQVI
jgi:hypothetical protein